MKRLLLLLPLLLTGCETAAQISAPKVITPKPIGSATPASPAVESEVSAPGHAPECGCEAKWRDNDQQWGAQGRIDKLVQSKLDTQDKRLTALEYAWPRKDIARDPRDFPKPPARTEAPAATEGPAGVGCEGGSCGVRGRAIGKGLFFRRR